MDRGPQQQAQTDEYSGGTTRRGTPDVFPGGTGGRIISQEAGEVQGHNLRRLTSPEEGAKENAERSNKDAHHIGKPEEDTTSTTMRGENTRPSFQEPKKRTNEMKSEEGKYQSQRPDLKGISAVSLTYETVSRAHCTPGELSHADPT
ncbi:hypothetical protein NDU88_004665 [Pleurodeles waltl]|uniref:Uncharacterized protein n=1 Tax=Pleurodeles waltl TaxID=8319 RepID=A0AAV7RJX0_PLEWA|nr:hypothetical protein NDU88_004665 [Pleurodeles waltl]